MIEEQQQPLSYEIPERKSVSESTEQEREKKKEKHKGSDRLAES